MKGNDLMEPKPNEDELIRQAMSVIGSRKTPRKAESSRVNVARATEARTGQTLSEEHRAKLKAAQQRRREREREALGVAGTAPVEKRPPGRPRKQPEAGSVADCETAPKRGRGRPRKEPAQMTDTNG